MGSIPVRTGEPQPAWRYSQWSEVYPRAYGGTSNVVNTCTTDEGLSPCVWGNPVRNSMRQTATRSIPVRTGEPLSGRRTVGVGGVYPRAYGGTFPFEAIVFTFEGLSPCVRGNRGGGCV